jgi:hypothetical protein
MDISSLALKNPKIMFEISQQLQNLINSDPTPTWFIKCAKNFEESRKKWQLAEQHIKELENDIDNSINIINIS